MLLELPRLGQERLDGIYESHPLAAKRIESIGLWQLLRAVSK